MNNKKSVLRAAVFLIFLSLLLGMYFRIITPKYYTNQIYSTTTTYKGFYNLKRDSLDVIFLGSSHGSTGFIPQEIYDSYGIRSYNLSCEMQNLATSYYWLCEALKTQHPKAVVIESAMLVTKRSDDDITEDFYCTKKALDAMKMSPNKLRAAKEMSDYFEEASLTEMLLPNVSYHDRWNELEKKDIEFSKWESYSEMRGYTVIPLEYGKEFEGYDFSLMKETSKKISAENRQRMDRIVKLCRENDIELILTITPAMSVKEEGCLATEEYARENNLTFLNFDDKAVLKELDYDYAKMNSDKGHLNIWGAAKVSNYIGCYLCEECQIESKKDEELESTSEYYSFLKDRCRLMYVTNADEYYDIASDERYDVIEKVITSSDEDGSMFYDGTDYAVPGIGTKLLVIDKREHLVVDCALIKENGEIIHSEMVELMMQ